MTVTVKLPDKKSVPKSRLEDFVTLLYGEVKVGKTTLLQHHENAFYAMFEAGGKSVATYQKPIPSWEYWIAYVKELRKDKFFRHVVIDTVDVAARQCVVYVCDKLGIDHPAEEDYGKGYDMIAAEFQRRMITELTSLGKGVTFVSHAEQKEVKSRSGEKFDRIQPTMSKMARRVIEPSVDIWAYYCLNGNRRQLHIEGDDLIAAGHRLETRFKYPDGNPIRVIPMGSSSKEAYRNFVDAFNNKLQKGGEVGVKSSATKKVSKVTIKRRI